VKRLLEQRAQPTTLPIGDRMATKRQPPRRRVECTTWRCDMDEPFFAVANPPESDGTFDQAIATVAGGLRVSG
jgi:hypothetical protein